MRESQAKIALSVLNVEEEQRYFVIKKAQDLGIANLHLDVMDGQFVNNTAIPLEQVNRLSRKLSDITIEVHLMVTNPESYIKKLDRSIEIVTVHVEAVGVVGVEQIINHWSKIFKIGVAISPKTPIERIQTLLPKLHHILVMSVNPGFGGQTFLPSALTKIRQLYQQRDNLALNYIIEVDGGVNIESANFARMAGADWLVCGTFLINNLERETINLLLV